MNVRCVGSPPAAYNDSGTFVLYCVYSFQVILKSLGPYGVPVICDGSDHSFKKAFAVVVEMKGRIRDCVVKCFLL